MFGEPRREPVRSSLKGAVQVQPVLRSGGASGGPASVQLNTTTSFDQEIAGQLGEFSSGKLAQAVSIKRERSLLEGQMARYQGKTYEQVQMEGDKWALEGYRVVDAQTMSSSLFQAQQSEIESGLYELDPDAYRARMMERVDGVLGTAKDKRTAELVKQQFLQQMPALVDAQTKAHLSWKEQKNFESVENSIDVISRDPTATSQLVSFARGGAGTATAGMSDDRRREATVAGVVRAFENDNPLAYAALAREGLLGENLTTDQINRVQGAKSSFENRRRSKYDASLFNGEQELIGQVEKGAIEPTEAVAKLQLLYADYNIEMNAQEAGAIYTKAGEGVRTATLTRGLVIDEALLRGDKKAAASAIIDSLITTESGGKASAFRTNKDSRQYGGLLQMGQARLDEWSAATGAPRITVAQFSGMSAAQQRSINEWHISQLLDYAGQKYGDKIGTKIEGVTVTLSGMVAAAHLGGKGGLDALMRGEARSDELGTSTLDYLRKHGAGAMDEMFTPQQKYAMAEQRLNDTRERLALDTYAAITPKLDEADTAFKRGEITKEQWQTTRNNLYSEYNSARTKADVDQEIAVARDANEYAMAQINEVQQYSAGIQMRAATEQFEQTAAAYEQGKVSNEDMQAATQQLMQSRVAIQQEYGLDFDAGTELAETDRVTARMGRALQARKEFVEGGVLIEEAVNSGSLDQLDPTLQKRAISEFQTDLMERANNRVALGKESTEKIAQDTTNEMAAWYAKSGVVDDRARRVLNGFLSEPLIDKEGNPNQRVVDAIENYDAIRQKNPTLADKYVDDRYRATLDAVISRAAGGSLAEAVRSVGMSSRDSASYVDPKVYLQREDVKKSIESEISNFTNRSDIGVLQAIFSPSASLSSWGNITGGASDRMFSAEQQGIVTDAIRREVEIMASTNQYLAPSDLVAGAAERVARRASFVGGNFVMLPPGKSIGEKFFGSRATEMMADDGAINDAVAEWLRSDEAAAQYPYLRENASILGAALDGLNPFGSTDASVADSYSYLTTGLHDYSAYTNSLTGDIVLQVRDSFGNERDPIVLPADRAGKMLMQKRKQEAIK